MAAGTWTTTDAEDAAILALGLDATVADFVTRHLRHQTDFALSEARQRDTGTVAAEIAALSAADRAAVDAILSKAKAVQP